MLRLLRPPLAASFLRSFRLHSPRYARETIAEKPLARVALVTASITQTGSYLQIVATLPSARYPASSTYTAPVPPSTCRADTYATTAPTRRNTELTAPLSTGPLCPDRNPLP